ncbi:serine/threonine-protein kinase [Nakamurella sp. A5-74]|uniref:non-specific serine/threonine protein kinase n=1 Tax=Nakamurella sp. A5-74 TaxID=3158264 RepID=A0AAU8DRL4_9ACTN
MHSDVDPPDDPTARAAPPAAGEGALLVDRYRLGSLIGRGGTAEVYRARDELLGRDVAVKVFDLQLTDLNSVDRQRSEMRALAALSDPHLVAVHDARLVEPSPGGPAGDHSYLVMELVNGETLAERLHGGPLGPDELTPIAVAVASGLAVAHAEGLIHRDIKPANVLIATSGAVKLADFGLARVVATESTLTSGSMLIGTAAYFSPEQSAGEHVGPPADVYALGLVLLEALTCRREFPGAPVPSAMARLLRDPEIPDGLPAPWQTLLLRMTDRDPDARPTAAEVVRILTAADSATLVGTAVTPRPTPAPILLPASPRRSPERSPEPVTAAGPSVLSAFLRPEGDDAKKVRRRNSVLVGAGALLTAVVLTTVITVTGGTTPPADGSPAVVQGGSSAARSSTEPAVTSAHSTATAGGRITPSATPTAVAARASVPPSSTARTSRTVNAAAASAAAARAAAARAAAARTAAARAEEQAAARAAAERTAAARAAEQAAARAAAARAEEQAAARAAAERTAAARAAEQAAARAAADRAAERAAAERTAAARAAEQAAARAAADRAAERAAAARAAADKAAQKAAEKQQKQDQKGASGSGAGASDKSGKPGKKP